MANQSIRQNRPNQVCDQLNTWSYAVIAVGEAATEQGAKNAAKGEAENKHKIH
jgi:hypothetical protein